MKRNTLLLLGIVLTLTFTLATFASAEGNARKGKYTYRKIYKSCSERGEVESKTPALSPDTKTQAQWERFFSNKEYMEVACKEEWSKLSEGDLEDIKAYLKGHAADSPTPAKCK